jgi:hypothetical protein|tara:strand:+ start:1330 stop:1983 length:654 start_codon:yes stop_codon:yes gene_type:complete
MALSTYSELQTTIASYLNRDDLTSIIPTFITLTENRLNRELRVRANMVRADTTTTADIAFYDLPSDMIELRNITYDSDSQSFALSYLSPESATREYGTITTGRPRAYTNLGNNIKLIPTPDGAYGISINYFAKLRSLSDSVTTNDVFSEYPSLYLFGACLEGAIYLNDTEQTNRFGTVFEKAVSDVKRAEDAARYSGTVMTTSIQGDPGALVRRGAY